MAGGRGVPSRWGLEAVQGVLNSLLPVPVGVRCWGGNSGAPARSVHRRSPHDRRGGRLARCCACAGGRFVRRGHGELGIALRATPPTPPPGDGVLGIALRAKVPGTPQSRGTRSAIVGFVAGGRGVPSRWGLEAVRGVLNELLPVLVGGRRWGGNSGGAGATAAQAPFDTEARPHLFGGATNRRSPSGRGPAALRARPRSPPGEAPQPPGRDPLRGRAQSRAHAVWLVCAASHDRQDLVHNQWR